MKSSGGAVCTYYMIPTFLLVVQYEPKMFEEVTSISTESQNMNGLLFIWVVEIMVTMLLSKITTPLGSPVVPLIYIIMHMP